MNGYWLDWTTASATCGHYWISGYHLERGVATTIVTHRSTYRCGYCLGTWVRVQSRDLVEYGVFTR